MCFPLNPHHRLDRFRSLLSGLFVEFNRWRLVFEAGDNAFECYHLHILALVASLTLDGWSRDKLFLWIPLLHLRQDTRLGNYDKGIAVALSAVG